MTNTPMSWAVVALLIAAAAVIVIVAMAASRRRARLRSVELKERFWPEYDRAVEEFGTPARAEHELATRARRVDHIRFRDLSPTDRARFTSSWSRLQLQFVDDPAAAVVGANELIKEVMRARGYSTDDFEQRVADLSVDHAGVVQHYRAARALADSSRNGEVHTEELRQAVVHYRALFADLLQEPASPAQLREIHA